MPKIKIITELPGYGKGIIYDVSPTTAARLVNAGVATTVLEPKEKKLPETSKKIMPESETKE